MFLEIFLFLNASLGKLSISILSFTILDAYGMEDERFRKNLVFPFEKFQFIEAFYKPFQSRRKHYFSTLKAIISRFWKK